MFKQVNNNLIEMTPDEIAAIEALRVPPPEQSISQLWQACNSYQSDRISPGGIAALMPYRETHAKAGEIIAWLDNLWIDYYSRRDAVEAGTFDGNYDFTNNGEMPHTFREARAEIEGA